MQTALNLLFPPQCMLCDQRVPQHGTVCTECWLKLRFVTAPICACCGFPFDYDLGEGALCAGCIRETPRFDSARTVFKFDDASKELIHKLKFQDDTYLAETLGAWLWQYGQEAVRRTDVIIPVPLYRWRLVKRRYNQSALLARVLGRHAGLPVRLDALIRKRATKPQTGLTRHQRRVNVRGAFTANPACAGTLKGARVTLVDDVMTTGSTIEACCKALTRAGASEVHVVTLARVVKVE